MSLVALVPFALLLLFVAFIVVAFIFWIWILIDCATNEPSQGNDKVIWILVLIFTHWIGAMIYLLVRRPERIRLYGR